MKIDILPTKLPDETLYSLTARLCRINGFSHDQEACEFAFGKSDNPRVADVWADLKYFSEATRNGYGDPNHVLESTTINSYLQGLGLYPARNQATNSRELATLSNGLAHVWRWCPSCLKDDMNSHGSPYWHRRHQLPGVFVCTQHKTSLLEVKIPFWMRQQRFMQPDSLPSSLQKRLSCPAGCDIEFACQLAKVAGDILEDGSTVISNQVLHEVIIDGLISSGLAGKDGKFRKIILMNALEGFLEPIQGIEDVRTLLNANRKRLIVNTAFNSNNPSSALFRLVMSYWLFGSWEMLKERCRWQSVISAEHARQINKVRIRSVKNSKTEKNHKQICIDFLQRTPNGNRTDFWKESPRSCRWLTLHEQDWLESVLPTAKLSHGVQLELFEQSLD